MPGFETKLQDSLAMRTFFFYDKKGKCVFIKSFIVAHMYFLGFFISSYGFTLSTVLFIYFALV